MKLRSGDRVDRYVLLDQLGEGAQGSVWKVRDLLDDTERALKIFDVATLSKQGAERARREAQAVAKLTHPAIVRCHALFELPAEGQLGLVFELVRGSSLAEVARAPHMTTHHRHALLVQVAAALEHVHSHGIVHRDLKPANILVADGFWAAPHALGGIKLVDFGIAAAVGNPQGVTATGAVIGTRPYLAPDLLLPGRWGPSSDGFARDIFAFGVLAWELLASAHPTGLPIDAPLERYAAIYKDAAARHRPWPPRGLPSPVAETIRACLAIDPSSRPADGGVLARALRGETVPNLLVAPPTGSAIATPTEANETRTEIDTAPRVLAPLSPATVPAAPLFPRTAVAPTEPSTTPMPGPAALSSLVTPTPMVEAASRRAPGLQSALERDARRTRSLGPWIAIGAITALLVIGVALYFVTIMEVTARTPVPLPQLPTYGTGPEPNTDPPAPVPCCGDAAACKSGRACTAGTCTAILPDRWWRVRVSGAARRSAEDLRNGPADAFPEDLSGTHPRARVCLQRRASPGSRACVPLIKAAHTGAGDTDNRLRVRTSDLVSGGLDIWIEDGGEELARGASAPNERGITTIVLCRGFSLYVGPRNTALAKVYGYLDDG